MLTEDQIAELKRLLEKTPTGERRWMTREEVIQVVDAVPALLDERALLVAVAEAGEGCSHLYYVNNAVGLKRLYATLAAWRTARDGVPSAGGAGKEG